MAEVSQHDGLVGRALRWLREERRPVHKATLAEHLGLTLAEAHCFLFNGAHTGLFSHYGHYTTLSARGHLWLSDRVRGQVEPDEDDADEPVRYRPVWPATGSRRGVYLAAPPAAGGISPRILGALSPGSALLLAELLLQVGGDPDLAARQAEQLQRAAALARQGEDAAGRLLQEARERLRACTNAAVVGGVAAGRCVVRLGAEADEAVSVRIAE
jgi:hypothetical protein